MSNQTYAGAPSPCYILEEELLRNNLSLISDVAMKAKVEIILAFKAFALWRAFPIFREYIHHTTASSPYEARLALEKFGTKAHTYSPAYEEETFDEILKCSSHITFNSLTQYARFYPRVVKWNRGQTESERISCGLRINPEYSEIKTELYNPCAPGSRFGLLSSQLDENLPEGIDGFHCHCHCESGAEALSHSLEALEARFGKWLPKLKWLNLGGGHLMTRKGYNLSLLVELLNGLHNRYPNLRIILEPGSAFLWQTGPLVSKVVDVVENKGIRTAILNVSFTCHMPDCLEMPYQPAVRGVETIAEEEVETVKAEELVYRLGGNSCLSGDFIGYWRFPKPLKVGDEVILEDMIHYTTVKTTMFNGIQHPAIALKHIDGQIEVLRTFNYEDYLNRMC